MSLTVKEYIVKKLINLASNVCRKIRKLFIKQPKTLRNLWKKMVWNENKQNKVWRRAKRAEQILDNNIINRVNVKHSLKFGGGQLILFTNYSRFYKLYLSSLNYILIKFSTVSRAGWNDLTGRSLPAAVLEWARFDSMHKHNCIMFLVIYTIHTSYKLIFVNHS